MNAMLEPRATAIALSYLTRITARGLKSGDFDHPLERMNIFVGRSASGKTARLDAIRLALNGGTLLGRASDLKSRTQDIMDLARDNQIEVWAEDDAGRKLNRRWVRGKNMIVGAADIPDSPSILMDPSAYFALSDAKKIEYAFSLVTLSDDEFSREAITADLRNIRLEHNTKETESALNDLLTLASGMAQESELAWESVQYWLGELIATVKLKLSEAKKSAERMTQTVQGITALASDVVPRNVEAELKAERETLSKLQAGLQWLEKQKADVESITRRREQIAKEIIGMKDDPALLADTQKQVEELEADILRIDSSPVAMPSDLADVCVQQLHNSITAHESAIAEIKAKGECCAACGQPLTKAIEERRDAISKANALINRIMEANAKGQREKDAILRTKRFHLNQQRTYLDGLKNLGVKRQEAEARLSELSLEGKPSVAGIQGEITECVSKVGRSMERVAELERGQRQFIQYKADEQRNAQALIEHGKAKAEVEVLKAGIERLEQAQGKMVSTAFDEILKTVNRVTEPLIPEPIQYRDGKLGRWKGACFVSHESFSKGEQALTYAGISLALAKDAPVKVVMIDELGRFDEDTIADVFGRMHQLIEEGVVSQFVGCLSSKLIGELTNIPFLKIIAV